MRKFSLSLVIASLLIGNIYSTAEAASPVKGGICKVVGSIQGLPNSRFICVKSGKKLIWQQYVAKPVAPVTPVVPAPVVPVIPKTPPTPVVPAKPVFKAPIPITLPVAPVGSVNFANLASKYKDIPLQAYSNIQASYMSGSVIAASLPIDIGPTTNTTIDVIRPKLLKELQIFNGFSLPTKFYAIAFSAADEKWAEAQWLKVAATYPFTNDPKNYIRNLQGNCEMNNGVAVNCGGGYTFMVPGSDTKFVFYGVENGNFWTANPPDYQTATQVNHEFTHALQDSQFDGISMHVGDNVITDTVHRALPCWMHEGQANALGIAIFAPDFQTYLTIRNRTVTNPLNPGMQNPLSSYSASEITAFLMGQELPTSPNTPGCYVPGTGNYQQGYYVGMAATEALIAIGGPQATIALIAAGANGADWSTAFQQVYGISWSDGATALGAALAAEYTDNPQRK